MTGRRYQIVYADFPWPYTSFGTAKLPYRQMTVDSIAAFDWSRWIDPKGSVVFSWVTGPKMQIAFEVARGWRERHGLIFQGVPFVWVKTRRDGAPMGATGPRPRLVKSLAEYVVAFSTHDKRVFPLQTESMSQWVFASRGKHSAKPPEVRERIVELLGDRPRVELFARECVPGWDAWGDELDGGGADE